MSQYRFTYSITRERHGRIKAHNNSILIDADDDASAKEKAKRWIEEASQRKWYMVEWKYESVELRRIIQPAQAEISEVVPMK